MSVSSETTKDPREGTTTTNGLLVEKNYAKKPLCRFFFNPEGAKCAHGSFCRFSHVKDEELKRVVDLSARRGHEIKRVQRKIRQLKDLQTKLSSSVGSQEALCVELRKTLTSQGEQVAELKETIAKNKRLTHHMYETLKVLKGCATSAVMMGDDQAKRLEELEERLRLPPRHQHSERGRRNRERQAARHRKRARSPTRVEEITAEDVPRRFGRGRSSQDKKKRSRSRSQSRGPNKRARRSSSSCGDESSSSTDSASN